MGSPETDIAQLAEKAGCTERDMEVGRYYISHSNLTAAIGRFGLVIKQCPTNSNVEEALAHLTKIYLAIGIYSEAQTAVAVLEHEFPSGHWTIVAEDALRAAGLEPSENEKSWISRAFKYPIQKL
jgi:outer membrane protein assembly factor BamD